MQKQHCCRLLVPSGNLSETKNNLEKQRRRAIKRPFFTSSRLESLRRNKFFIRRMTLKKTEHVGQTKMPAQNNPTNQLTDTFVKQFSTHHCKNRQLSITQKISNTTTIAIEQNNNVLLQQLRIKLQHDKIIEPFCNTIITFDFYCSLSDLWCPLHRSVIKRNH